MKIFFILLCLLVGIAAQGQVVGNPFPDLEGETLDDKKVKLPEATKGKYTLIGMAYSKRSEDELTTWFQPVFEKFIDKGSGGGGLFATIDYDVNVYFIPMFTGVNAA